MKDLLLLLLLQVHLVFIWHQVALPALSELVYEVAVPWKKSISDKEPGISHMIPGHCLICLSCDITGLGNLLFTLFPISKWCLRSLHSLLQIAACGRRYLQHSFCYPQATSHMFETGKKGWGSHRHPNSTLGKGSSSARAKSSAADGFQPTGLPGISAVSGCSLPNIVTP